MTPTQQQLVQAERDAQKRKLRDAFRLQLKLHKVEMPVEEYKFHKTRGWRLDDAWPVHRVAIEYHGGIYSNGRHVRGQGFEQDREKMNEALLEGWQVLEVTSHHIDTLQALGWVMRVLPDYVPDTRMLPRQGRRIASRSTVDSEARG